MYCGIFRNERLTGRVECYIAFGLACRTPRNMTNADLLDSIGGAVPSDSKFYVERVVDRQFESAIRGKESIILVKGPRQVGKTSLIGRGLRLVDDLGWRGVMTDFQNFGSRQLETDEAFYDLVATTLSLDLNYTYEPDRQWTAKLGPSLSFRRFLKELIASSDQQLVWFIDEADRLFGSAFASDFFGLVRACHNARATDLRGPWSRLTIVIGYATEAHLFIDNLNQSPFNVGRAVKLPMFTLSDTKDLNERYGRPIGSDAEVQKLQALLDGQPFLTRRAFDALVSEQMSFSRLMADADNEEGPFGDHLKRVLVAVTQLPFVWEALKNSIATTSISDSRGLHRLVAAGVLVRRQTMGYGIANDLYRRFLSRFMNDETAAAATVVRTLSSASPAETRVLTEDPAVFFDAPALILELVRLRKKRNISQGQMAQTIGISQSRLSQIENLQGGVPFETVIEYARAIGANLAVAPADER